MSRWAIFFGVWNLKIGKCVAHCCWSCDLNPKKERKRTKKTYFNSFSLKHKMLTTELSPIVVTHHHGLSNGVFIIQNTTIMSCKTAARLLFLYAIFSNDFLFFQLHPAKRKKISDDIESTITNHPTHLVYTLLRILNNESTHFYVTRKWKCWNVNCTLSKGFGNRFFLFRFHHSERRKKSRKKGACALAYVNPSVAT